MLNYLYKFHVYTFYSFQEMEGERLTPPPSSPGNGKKPSMNRVKTTLALNNFDIAKEKQNSDLYKQQYLYNSSNEDNRLYSGKEVSPR